MIKGWKERTLGDVAEISAGNPAPQDKKLFINGKHPFFRTADAGRIRFGVIHEAADYLHDDGIKRLRRFPKDTILFPKSGASTFLNHRVMLGVEGFVSSHLATIIADRTQVNPRFLLYFLSTISAQDMIQDHAYPSLNLPSIARIGVLVPPFDQQERIVEILDEAFEGIATAKANAGKNVQNASAIFESYVRSIFTQRGLAWMNMKLGDACNKITDGTHKTPSYTKEGVPFLSVKNLTQGFIDFSNTRFISAAEHEFLTRRCKPVRGDILYTKVGTTGIAQVVDVDDEFSIFVSVALLKPKHDVVFNLYLEHFLNAPYAREQAQMRTRGMANRNLVITDIKEIGLHFPKSLNEQRTIVAKLESLSAETQRLESIYHQKLAALDALKKSLLHQAFSGQL